MLRQENIPNRLPVHRTIEKPELLERGLFILNRLGLNIEDLKDKKIVDIGSNQAALETLLRHHKINNIISIDSRLPWMSSNKELNQINATAKHLPIKDSSIDLIIAHAGPPTTHRLPEYKKNKEILNSEEKRVQSYLDEYKRILTKDGEARIAPARLWFIYMNNLNNIYQGKEELPDQLYQR
jgi:hypothetical protein